MASNPPDFCRTQAIIAAMRLGFLPLLVCTLALLGFVQDDDWSLKFEDYAVKKVFNGTPARPIIVKKEHQEFRSAINDAAAKGPNFAGHYTVAQWDCGSSCLGMAVIDEATGKVFPAPFTTLTMPFVDGEDAHAFKGLVFDLKSRLFIADGCPEDKQCATNYYEWKDESFKNLRMVPQKSPATPSDSSEQ